MAKVDNDAKVWMPLFIGDYLADTSRLSTEQHGAYMLLIMDYWRNGPPPDDAVTLAQITRLSLDAWSIAQAMLKHLFSIEGGVWRHKRIDSELVAAKENKGKAQAKAKAAADARWGKGNSDASSIAPSTPQALLEECPSPSPSSLKTKSKTKAPATPKYNPVEEMAALGVQAQTAHDWMQVRKVKKAPLTKTAMDEVIAQADKAGLSLERTLALCCVRGWAGFKAHWLLNDPDPSDKPPTKDWE